MRTGRDARLRPDGRGLAGEYTVRLIATSGEKRGRQRRRPARAAGAGQRLPDSMDRWTARWTRRSAFRSIGTAEVNFAAVGATIPGDPGSSDPSSPGVLVIERPGGVMLRLGSDANRRGVRRFDGGYMVLQVQQVSDSGFAGTWRSAVRSGGIGRALLRRRSPDRREGSRAKRTAGEISISPAVRCDGGAGNRTLVRVSFRNGVYVRRSGFLPLPRGGARPTSPWPSS